MPAAFRADPEATCDSCGAAGAFRFEQEAICGDCYAVRGATCCTERDDARDAPACQRTASERERGNARENPRT